MRKGFYTHEYIYEALRNVVYEGDYDDECPYTDAYDFLQGSCDIFAEILSETFGYKRYIISDGNSFHIFCKLFYNTEEVYIDIRGYTSDYNEFVEGLPYVNKATACIRELNAEDKTDEQEWYMDGLSLQEWLSENI